MKIIYAEPAKYNQTIILNALKGNLSGDNFGDLHGSNLWWQGVDVSTTDKHISQSVNSKCRCKNNQHDKNNN